MTSKKVVTYKAFIKANKIPKEKISTIIPARAVTVVKTELPDGIDCAVARTDGLGYELCAVYDYTKKELLVRRCRKEHGQWFCWLG